MSTDNAPPSDASGHGDSHVQHRRASAESPSSKPLKQNKLPKSSDSLVALGLKELKESSSIPETSALVLQDVLQKGNDLKDNPDDAKEWIRGFGEFVKGTEVSTRLRDLGSKEGEISYSSSFLTIISTWIKLWFTKLEKARRDYKSRSGTVKEQQDLDWLFQFAQDYLQIGHLAFPESDLASLLENVTDICLKTNKQSDINNALEILFIVLSHYPFPKQVLEQCLVVLSASMANLVEPPKHLQDCFRLLATSNLGEDVVKTLFEFIRTPTLQNNAKNLSHARGATRLLRTVISTRHRSGGYIYTLGLLVAVIRDAARQRIFRFCVDIMQCCHTVLSTEQRKNEMMSLDFGEITEILELCLTTNPNGASDSSTPTMTTFSGSMQDDENDRQYERHFRDREHCIRLIGSDLEHLWLTLSDRQQAALNDYVLSFPQYATSIQLFRSVRYAAQKRLFWPGRNRWEKNLDHLLRGIVQDQVVEASCRVEMITVLDSAIVDANEEPSDEDLADRIQEAGDMRLYISRIVSVFLKQAAIERNKDVMEVLMDSLQKICNTSEEKSEKTTSISTVVDKLSIIARPLTDPSDTEEERACLATRALAQIFMGSLHTGPDRALHTYNTLLDIASMQCKARRARIEAMRILYRIRADASGWIYFQATGDSEYIATALCRTRSSADAFNYEAPNTGRDSASSTTMSNKPIPYEPLWMYEDDRLPYKSSASARRYVSVEASNHDGDSDIVHLDITSWLLHVIRCLQSDSDWETYSFTLIHLGSQLSNISLFDSSLYTIVKLRQVLCEQVVNASFREPPASTGLKKSDVALCLYSCLTPLVAYATIRREPIQKGFGDDLVRAFVTGIAGVYEGSSRGCIHALSLCCLEIPSSVASLYPNIVDKLSKNMTQTHLTINILEFLAQVASLPAVHSNFNQDEITMIFGVCIQFLEKTREQYQIALPSQNARTSTPSRQSGLNLKRPPYRAAMLKDVGLPQYAAALAYNTMTSWFLSLKLDVRAKIVSWIVPRLVWKNSRGEEVVDEQSQVFIDMMQRTAFSDLGETSRNPIFSESTDGPVSSASWLVGLSIITVETAGHTGLTQISKRQASGTTYAIYQQSTATLPPHHAPSYTEIRQGDTNDGGSIEILPPHVLLQMVATAIPTNTAEQPIPLPKEDYVIRALEAFDRIPTVDSHKVGILFIDEGQTEESQFLANQAGSADYERFLRGLGYKVSLEPPLRFNPQGLQYPRDGKSTIAWRDRTEEIVFHIPTMMPNDMEDDPHFITKKAHVGNCHVNVIFNKSGKHWNFANFRSQLNYANIVVTPASEESVILSKTSEALEAVLDEVGSTTEEKSHPVVDHLPEFYKVHVLTNDDLPNILPAADPKIISAAQLPLFVRVLALNANIFSQAWNTKDHDKEFPSSWRARLQQIKMLRDRVVSKTAKQDIGSSPTGPNPSQTLAPASASGRRTPVPREDSPGIRREAALATQLDFGKWALR